LIGCANVPRRRAAPRRLHGLTISLEARKEVVMTTKAMSEFTTTTKLTVLVAAFIAVVVAALMLLGR
jgi:hypothetical protein